MAIAGIEPDVNESPYVQYDEDLYTTEQVREILMKASQEWLPYWDYYNDEPIENDFDRIVDEFMESDGED